MINQTNKYAGTRTILDTHHDPIGPPPKIITKKKPEGLTCVVIKKKRR